MPSATRFADGDYGGPRMVYDFLGVVGSKPFDSSLLKREQSHQMLPHLPKHPRVVSTANTLIILQNSLRQTGSTKFNIADHGEP